MGAACRSLSSICICRKSWRVPATAEVGTARSIRVE